MDIIDIAGRTRVFGAPQDWNEERDGPCGGLPIRDETFAPGVNLMVSEWKPNEIELEHLKLGAPLQLGVIGDVHPVVSLGVGAVPAPDALAAAPTPPAGEAVGGEYAYQDTPISGALAIQPAPTPQADDLRKLSDAATPYTPQTIYYPDSDVAEFVTQDGAHLYHEIDYGAALVLDMDSRQIVGFRIQSPRAWISAVSVPAAPQATANDPYPEYFLDDLGRPVLRASCGHAGGPVVTLSYKKADDAHRSMIALSRLLRCRAEWDPAAPQATDEPVAWEYEQEHPDGTWSHEIRRTKPTSRAWFRNIRPLYAAPAASRVGVTEEEILQADDSDLRREALFLVERLREFENEELIDLQWKHWFGHVAPSFARLAALLSAQRDGGETR